MVRADPYPRTTPHRYECRSCLTVVTDEERLSTCPDCGGRMKNVSVPRE